MFSLGVTDAAHVIPDLSAVGYLDRARVRALFAGAERA
jgi:hypothetical protein